MIVQGRAPHQPVLDDSRFPVEDRTTVYSPRANWHYIYCGAYSVADGRNSQPCVCAALNTGWEKGVGRNGVTLFEVGVEWFGHGVKTGRKTAQRAVEALDPRDIVSIGDALAKAALAARGPVES